MQRPCSVRLALVIIALAAMPRVAFAAEPEENFTPLFNGTNLDGWHVMNGGKFAVVDGVIKLDGGGGWLRSDKEYTDFVLRLEVRWLKPKQDSGVFLRAGEEGDNWPSRRYEVQAENSERIVHIFGAKCMRDADKAFELLKPDQEWNSLEIKCRGTQCEVKLNGELAATADDLKNHAGYIGFQGEGGQLEWRNIRIQLLTHISHLTSRTLACDLRYTLEKQRSSAKSCQTDRGTPWVTAKTRYRGSVLTAA